MDRVPPPVLFAVGAVSLYVGSALAVQTFDAVGAVGASQLRCAGAAAILCAWRRPWRSAAVRRALPLVAAFGLALTAMNTLFYLAIDRLPLGTAVAIEFVGPVVVAAAGSRRARDGLALGLATVGVLLLADVRWEGSPSGVGFALGAATLWATYIVLGHRIAAGGPGAGLDALAAAAAIGAVTLLPVGAVAVAPAVTGGEVAPLVAGLAVGLLSSVVPYALDQVVLGRMGPASFALLLSLLPATATVVGLVLLSQVPTGTEVVGIALVAVAVATRSRAGAPGPRVATGSPP